MLQRGILVWVSFWGKKAAPKIIEAEQSEQVINVIHQSHLLCNTEDHQLTSALPRLTGMSGLQQAASDPAMLAQLMEDMADPEMMAEAQKMMNDPEFKRQMKKLEKSPEFKNAMKQAQAAMEDPQTAARMQASAEHMMRKGSAQLESMAGDVAKAMEVMENNPQVMKEMADLMKDPEKLKQLMDDPQVRQYMEQTEKLMKDPAYREKMEAMATSFRGQL